MRVLLELRVLFEGGLYMRKYGTWLRPSFFMMFSQLIIDGTELLNFGTKELPCCIFGTKEPPCPNVSTTPIMAIGCRQCLPLSVVQLKGKHCQKTHCCNGVVDTFRPCGIRFYQSTTWQQFLVLNLGKPYLSCFILNLLIFFIFNLKL